MPDTYTNILLHIVFGTKFRQPFITEEIESRLYEYMGGMIRNRRGVLYEIGGMEDHVHLLVRWNTEAIKSLTREMKSESTKWVRSTFPTKQEFQWQSGGGIFSVSQSNATKVVEYIRNQKTHHRVKSFQEEYIEFLVKHGIEYNERYLFD